MVRKYQPPVLGPVGFRIVVAPVILHQSTAFVDRPAMVPSQERRARASCPKALAPTVSGGAPGPRLQGVSGFRTSYSTRRSAIACSRCEHSEHSGRCSCVCHATRCRRDKHLRFVDGVALIACRALMGKNDVRIADVMSELRTTTQSRRSDDCARSRCERGSLRAATLVSSSQGKSPSPSSHRTGLVDLTSGSSGRAGSGNSIPYSGAGVSARSYPSRA